MDRRYIITLKVTGEDETANRRVISKIFSEIYKLQHEAYGSNAKVIDIKGVV